MTSESSNLHHIIVVGGGASGLELVTGLGDKLGRRKLADVTLIDKSRTHLWKPLLHEIAAGTMDFAVHEIDYLAQAHWHSFRYRIGEMIAVDRILPALPERLSDAALKLLKSLGVRVHTSSKVAEVSATGVKLASGRFIPAELVVWAAGVKAPDVLANLDGLESTGSNHLLV